MYQQNLSQSAPMALPGPHNIVANSRQRTSWQLPGSNCEKAPGHTISYNTLSHMEILLYVWQHIVAKIGEYNPKPGIPENTDVADTGKEAVGASRGKERVGAKSE